MKPLQVYKASIRIRVVTLLSLLIVVYVMLFEWRSLFLAHAVQPLVYTAKFIIPILLFIAVPLFYPCSRHFTLFILFFASFMLWGLIPSLFSGYYPETLIQWFKFLPRVLFSLVVGSYFLRRPEASIKAVKWLMVIAVLTAIQYLLLVPTSLFGIAKPVYISGARGVYYGPYGIFGNQSALMSFSNLSVPVLRLTGFWPEPSNASGFLFAVFFLAQAVYIIERKSIWWLISYLSLVCGFLTLSMAGYFAIANATLFGTIVRKKSWKNIIVVAPLAMVSVIVICFAVWGRAFVAEHYYESGGARAIAGVRGGPRAIYLEDPYSGRIGDIAKNVEVWKDNPLGIGFRIPGIDFFEDATGTAPILWLAYTGLIGGVLLCFRELQVLCPALKYSRNSELVRKVSQAWVAMFSQHMLYGDLMSPMYLLLCVLVIGMTFHRGDFAREECPNRSAKSERRPYFLKARAGK
ncbi:MAG: hypothetical protein XU15_C0016G0010 [candidate division NC10 bacterium CSP1-5]|nr:MAG: hypothetical protein XU15_C0016G0010 [candidate division NC10 bacterium CSP1-5]